MESTDGNAPAATRGGNRTASTRISRFVFTLNNPTEPEVDSIKEYNCRWLCFGREIAPGTGTPHLQGACVVGKQTSIPTIKRHYGFGRAHLEVMRGTPEDSLAYCSKEDRDPFIKGVMPRPGTRSDLSAAAEKIKGGATMKQLAEEHPEEVIKYARGLTYLRSCITGPRKEKPTVIWISGPTGLGKTETAYKKCCELFGADSTWLSNGTLQWFCGYDGQPGAILDDFRPKHCEFSFLLRLLDKYPFKVPIKGAHVEWLPELIFVTAPTDPRTSWSFRTTEQLEQLCRRIDFDIDARSGLSRVSGLSRTSAFNYVMPGLQGGLQDDGLLLPGLDGGEPLDDGRVLSDYDSDLSFEENKRKHGFAVKK